MNKFEYINKLKEILGVKNVHENEPMSKHTSFNVGGNADIFLTIDSIEKLEKILNLDYDIPMTIIGNGSNVLVKDSGIRGVVIRYTASDYKILSKNNNHYEVSVDSGLLNGKLAYILLNEGLTGFESAAGIPGTVGGAIYMNAGAYGREIKDVVKTVTYFDLDDNSIHTITNEECKFLYRKSIFMEKNSVILNAIIVLEKGDSDKIKEEMDKNLKYRVSTQPVEYPNGGSTFKRGDDFITAKLIDEAGLKGTQIGGAQVSTKHAGFIINYDNATADDILRLAKFVQDEVFKKYNKKIELEVRILG